MSTVNVERTKFVDDERKELMFNCSQEWTLKYIMALIRYMCRSEIL